jgi:hypothetical protein
MQNHILDCSFVKQFSCGAGSVGFPKVVIPIPVSVISDPVDTKFDEAIAIHVTPDNCPYTFSPNLS